MVTKRSESPADCGLHYDHDRHPYVVEGMVQICDGDTKKREGSNG